MFIDKNTGTLELPNGLVITTDFNKSDFESSAHFGQAISYDFGTLPFQWYRLEGGHLDGHILNVNLCFYSEVLVDCSISANFYQSNPSEWENFSFEIESQTKTFHDRLLQNELGKPHRRVSVPVGQNQPVLDYRLEYDYKWGAVWSSYDSRAGFSTIGIRYGSRLRDAQDDYRIKRA